MGRPTPRPTMQSFLIALQFLTCLPVRLQQAPSEQDTGRSALFYPVVGLVLGTLLALPLRLGVAWTGTPLLWAALTLSLWVMLTGGLHLDGLADSVDAWVGGRGQRERTLTLMKDPHCGPMAVIALTLVLVLKLAALDTLVIAGQWWLLGLPLILGRQTLILLFLSTPYARPQGLGVALTRHLPRKPAVLVLLLTTLGLVAVFKFLAVLTSLLALALLWGLRRAVMQRLGGTTGDTAGALVEITETAVLILCALALRYTH